MKFYKTLFLLTTLIGGSYVCYKKNKENSINKYEPYEKQKEDDKSYWFEYEEFEEKQIDDEYEELLEDLKSPSVFELNDFSFVLKACTQNGMVLKLANDELRDNKNIVMVACNNFGIALQYASDRLRDDEEVVRIAYEQDIQALEYASDRLKESYTTKKDNVTVITKKQALEMVEENGLALQNLPDFQDDEDVVLQAIKNDGHVIQFASERLRDDKSFILTCIESDVFCLHFASDRLKNDKEIVMLSVKQRGWALKFASDRFRNDPEIVKLAVGNYGRALCFASDELKDDKEIVMIAVQQNSSINYGTTLQYASERLQNDKDVVLKACKNNGSSLDLASDRLKADKDFVLKVLEIEDDYCYVYNCCVNNSNLCEDEDVMLKIVEEEEWVLKYHDYFSKNISFLLKACQINSTCQDYAHRDIQEELQEVLDDLGIFNVNDLELFDEWSEILNKLNLTNHNCYEPLKSSKAYIKNNDIFISLNKTFSELSTFNQTNKINIIGFVEKMFSDINQQWNLKKVCWNEEYAEECKEDRLLTLQEIELRFGIPKEKAYTFFTKNNINGVKDEQNHNRLMYTNGQISKLEYWWNKKNNKGI